MPPPHSTTVDITTNKNNNYFSQEEDQRLFLATGYRYSFAQERGFTFPWCAKKHGRKGWIVRDCPPLTYKMGGNLPAPTTSVEFKGWKEAQKVFQSQQLLMQRFGVLESSMSGKQGEGSAAQRDVNFWFQQMPAAMHEQRKSNQIAIEDVVKRNRKRVEVDLRRKRREELREKQALEKIERKKQKAIGKQSECSKQLIVESVNNQEGESRIECSISKLLPLKRAVEETKMSSPSKSKRKGTLPKRGNLYRDIERSFIENKSFLPPVKYPDSAHLFSPTTPTRISGSTKASHQSPTRTKYKKTQPRKNQHQNSQPNSIILGEDPLMDQMIEDMVKEFTCEGPLAFEFDVGAVSALREAALDVIVHNHEEKNSTSPQQVDDRRMESMIEQLIGEVAHDSGCNFEGDAVEALKIAAKEIVTKEDGSFPGDKHTHSGPLPGLDEGNKKDAS